MSINISVYENTLCSKEEISLVFRFLKKKKVLNVRFCTLIHNFLIEIAPKSCDYNTKNTMVPIFKNPICLRRNTPVVNVLFAVTLKYTCMYISNNALSFYVTLKHIP